MAEETNTDSTVEPIKGGEADKARRSTIQAIREEAEKIGGQAGERARTLADEGKERATNALDELAKMLESAAGEVDTRLGEQYGRYARSASEGVAGFSSSLRDKQVDDLMSDVQDFVKKSPAIAIGTAAAVGFVLARLLKSGFDAARGEAEPEVEAASDPSDA